VFYSVKGNIEAILDNAAVIECGGVGYLIQASGSTLAELSGKTEAKLYTTMLVRENDVSLIGFISREDLRIFELLTSINGVGAKAALSIQSTLSDSDIVLAVISDDDKALSRAPGVGKKIAQRIILELQGKFKGIDANADSYVKMGMSAATPETPKQEAVEALVALGFSRMDAVKTVAEVALDEMTVEDIIKATLRKLAGK